VQLLDLCDLDLGSGHTAYLVARETENWCQIGGACLQVIAWSCSAVPVGLLSTHHGRGTSTSQTFRRLHACCPADTVTDWRQEFLCSRTVAMEQPTDRDPGETLRSDIIDNYLRCFCSFRLRRIVTFYLSAPGISTLTHSLTHSLTHHYVSLINCCLHTKFHWNQKKTYVDGRMDIGRWHWLPVNITKQWTVDGTCDTTTNWRLQHSLQETTNMYIVNTNSTMRQLVMFTWLRKETVAELCRELMNTRSTPYLAKCFLSCGMLQYWSGTHFMTNDVSSDDRRRRTDFDAVMFNTFTAMSTVTTRNLSVKI